MKKPSLQSISQLALLPCLIPMASPASAAIWCNPTASATTVRPGQTITLRENCVDRPDSESADIPLTAGTATWIGDSTDGSVPIGTHVLSSGEFTVTAPTSLGSHYFAVSRFDTGYGGPVWVNDGEGAYVTITVAEPATQATLTQSTDLLLKAQTGRVRTQMKQVDARLRQLRTSRTTPTFDVQGVPLPKKNDADGGDRRFGAYILGLDDYLHQKATSTDTPFTVTTTAVTVGADYRLSDAWVFGAGIGIADTQVAFASALSAQQSSGNSITTYASWSVTTNSYISATLSYESSSIELTRDDGTGRISTASPRGKGLGVSLSGGYDFAMGAWSLGPYARLDSITSKINAFDETGSSAAASIGAQTARSSTLSVGAQTQVSIPVSWGLVLPHVRLELTRRKDATRQSATATLLSDNTTLLVPAAADADNKHGSLAVGVSGITQHGISWFADLESGFAHKGYSTQRIVLGLRAEL